MTIQSEHMDVVAQQHRLNVATCFTTYLVGSFFSLINKENV